MLATDGSNNTLPCDRVMYGWDVYEVYGGVVVFEGSWLVVFGGSWLVVACGWWLVVGGWWLVVGGWWL